MHRSRLILGAIVCLVFATASCGLPDENADVATPAATATPQPGEPVVINGLAGTLRESTMADGQQAASISIVIDTVAVEAHGNVGAEQLKEIVASMRPFDDVEWADLVDSVQQPPVG